MPEGPSGVMLLRRMWLAMGLLAAIVVIGGGVLLVELDQKRVRNRAGLEFAHLAAAVAELHHRVHRATFDDLVADRAPLRATWLEVATHYVFFTCSGDRDSAFPSEIHGESRRCRLAVDAARRRLASADTEHHKALADVSLPAYATGVAQGAMLDVHLAEAIAETLLLTEAAAFGEGPLTGDDLRFLRTVTGASADNGIEQDLHRASVSSMAAVTTAGETIRSSVIVGLLLLLCALLATMLLLLQPVANRVERDRVALAAARDRALDGARAKAEFLATMSHELRTPLNGVAGMASLLAATRLDARQTGLVDTIRVAAENLSAVIEDILEYNALDTGRLRLAREPFSVEALGTVPLGKLAPVAAMKGLDVICRIDPCAMRSLIGDAKRLDHIIVNLLSNAIKFTPDGLIMVEIATRALDTGRAMLRVAVRDTGPGVPPEDAARIFGLFVQGDQSVTRHRGGTGLGLAICRTLIDLMGGRIGVEPNGGRGACFWIEVELAVADPTPFASLDPLMQGRRIAAVSACAERRAALAERLSGCGAIAFVMADTGPLWDDPDQPAPDCVIIDQNPPGHAADEPLAQLADLLPDTPVVLLTAGDTALHHPLCTVLRKPPTAESMHEALETALGLGEARRLLLAAAEACDPALAAEG